MILFLDYDGVLHPDAAYLTQRGPVLRADGALFMWAPLLLKAISEQPDVRIVLSTSWVRLRGFKRARAYLPPELQSRVIGATWHSRIERHNGWESATRYQEIQRYVRRAHLTDWLALDDDTEGWPEHARHHLIATDGDRGLSDPHALERLHQLLGRKDDHATP